MLKNKIKIVYNIIFTFIVKKVGKTKDKEKSILLFSYPRSGSTWVQNILSLNDSAIIFEPFHVKHDKSIIPFTNGINNNIIIDRTNSNQFERLFNMILKGERLTRWSTNYSGLKRFLSCKFFIVKILRGNLSLDWFNEIFKENKKIVLIRHPCAVIKSMKNSPGGWHEYDSGYIKKLSYIKFENKFDKIIDEFNQQHFLMMFQWCIETKALLMDYNENSNLLIYYEDIFESPEVEISKIFAFLGSEIPLNFKEKHKEKSQTTNNVSSLDENKPLESWLKSFSKEELQIFQYILDKFEINIYKTSSFKPIRING